MIAPSSGSLSKTPMERPTSSTPGATTRRRILAFARAGRRGHALRQFLACRHALVTTLGVEPSEETSALQRWLLAGEVV